MTEPAAASAYDHSGPPAYVPLSGGAVTALVLSIVAGFLGTVGPWWIEVVPLLVVLMSWGGIARRVRRGRVVAILAIVFSLAGGALSYVFQKAAAVGVGDAFARVVVALDRGDRAKLDAWAGTGPEHDARIERWSARAAAARAAEGAFAGTLEVSFVKWGLLAGLLAPPAYREEFEPKGTKPPETGATFWFRAPCANGDVYVAFDYGTPERFSAAMNRVKAERPAPGTGVDAKDSIEAMFAGAVDEIRFFH